MIQQNAIRSREEALKKKKAKENLYNSQQVTAQLYEELNDIVAKEQINHRSIVQNVNGVIQPRDFKLSIPKRNKNPLNKDEQKDPD